MTLLSDADRELLEGLPFDADAEVAFNEVTACLVWADEVPDGLSRDGYRVVRDLLGARGLIHRGVSSEDWDYGFPDRLDRWNEALAEGLRWNGFRRLALTGGQRALLRRSISDETAL